MIALGRQIRAAMLHRAWIWIYQDDNRTEEADP